jgi:hypothetical protein
MWFKTKSSNLWKYPAGNSLIKRRDDKGKGQRALEG